jgi:AcrR family transcriptional regulator
MHDDHSPGTETRRPAAEAATRARSRRGPAAPAPGEGQKEGDSRQRVIDAAIRCILEQGFYRASSNAIADYAGVSWGVIQYHFGSREALMLAVFQEGTGRLTRGLRSAEITGSSLDERLEQLLESLAQYYESPDYLAFTQVLLNLAQDPRTSDTTRTILEDIGEAAAPEFERLLHQVLTGTGVRSEDLGPLLFHSLRGLALSHVMLNTVPIELRGHQGEFAEQRKMLARAMSLLIGQWGGTSSRDG